jgi:hypothetical protein
MDGPLCFTITDLNSPNLFLPLHFTTIDNNSTSLFNFASIRKSQYTPYRERCSESNTFRVNEDKSTSFVRAVPGKRLNHILANAFCGEEDSLAFSFISDLDPSASLSVMALLFFSQLITALCALNTH